MGISNARNRVVWLSLGILFATTGITFWGHAAAQGSRQTQQFDTVSVRTLRVVDEQGRPRFVIAAPLPNPVVEGKQMPRSSPVVGIQFLDIEGNETGGLAIIDKVDGAALCFDYNTAEAMCFTKARNYKGITLLDPPVAKANLGEPGSTRLELSVDNGLPRIALCDKQGKERIVLSLDASENPVIETLDAEGKPISPVYKQ